jgi:hypothetical protein
VASKPAGAPAGYGSAGYQPESGEWIGEPGQRIDSGRVAGSSRWWSDKWWSGHHFSRNACGQFGEPGTACRRRHGHKGRHAFIALPADSSLFPGNRAKTRAQAGAGGRKLSEREQVARDYRAYLESRHNAAEAATRGVLLSPQGKTRNVAPGKWFTGRAGVSRKGMSEELADWFRANGPNLTASQFRLQQTEQAGAARSWFGGRVA